MAFIQCSSTGTALSWYIRSDVTFKQDWPVLYNQTKNNSHHRNTLTMHNSKRLFLSKRTMKQLFTLQIQQLVEKDWCNENALTII